MAYFPIEPMLSKAERDYVALCFLHLPVVQSITSNDYVNICATAEDMKENFDTVMKRINKEAKATYCRAARARTPSS